MQAVYLDGTIQYIAMRRDGHWGFHPDEREAFLFVGDTGRDVARRFWDERTMLDIFQKSEGSDLVHWSRLYS